MSHAEQIAVELNARKPALAVLMATYEGEQYIADQLKSFDAQDVADIKLIVSDDSRSDSTRDAILRHTRDLASLKVEFLRGPQAGFVENFRSLILNCATDAEFYAFSDQDDIWLADKTKRSLDWLRTQSSNVPALYCGRTCMIDQHGAETGRLSPLFPRAPAFENAIVQSIAGGNTMTMNRAALDLLKRSLSKGIPISHDWWTYIIVSGAGGAVKYDPQPLTLYRQHDGNLIGENRSYLAKIARMKMVMNGTWRDWQDTHIALLDANVDELTKEAQASLQALKQIRNRSALGRLSWFRRSGAWRQTTAGSASLYFAVLMGRV